MTRLATLALSAVLFTAVAASAQDTARMEQVIQSHVSAGTFMGTVLVARDGAVIVDKAYGMANVEWDVPNTTATKFRLGSITKQFTAAAILLLEERGKLKVDDRVKSYLPDSPMAWDRITIFNLLTHTAGIPNFTVVGRLRHHQAERALGRRRGHLVPRAAARLRSGREDELQQFRLPGAGRDHREGQRADLREVRGRQPVRAGSG